jgi:hypothetical protein
MRATCTSANDACKMRRHSPGSHLPSGNCRRFQPRKKRRGLGTSLELGSPPHNGQTRPGFSPSTLPSSAPSTRSVATRLKAGLSREVPASVRELPSPQPLACSRVRPLERRLSNVASRTLPRPNGADSNRSLLTPPFRSPLPRVYQASTARRRYRPSPHDETLFRSPSFLRK